MVSTMVVVTILIVLSLTVLTTIEAQYTANYTGVLTTSSQNFTRNGKTGTFYYQAIEVRVSTAGTYTFGASSSISDTYGSLYQGNFYPTYPQYNIVRQDDDAGAGNQFQITTDLRPDITYILIFTTYSPLATGSINVDASGPGTIYMTPININTL